MASEVVLGRARRCSAAVLARSTSDTHLHSCTLPLLFSIHLNAVTNLTRCQEDRAAALSQSQHQAYANYVPECSEDGAFLQVTFLV